MHSAFRRLGPSELLPRYLFIQGLIAGGRVLELGAVSSTRGRSAHFLRDLGARSVVAWDADAAGVEQAKKAFEDPDLHFVACAFEELAGAKFDLVLVGDLADCVRRPRLISQLRGLLSVGGCLLGGVRNQGALSLSQLIEPDAKEGPTSLEHVLEVLRRHFSHVRVGTQTPLIGYQLAFEDAGQLRVDSTLASAAADPAYFIVLVADEPCPVFEPTWIQLPPEPLGHVEAAREADQAALATAQAKLEELSRELESLRRSMPRSRLQVQQIYRRAAAGLDAVRAELSREREAKKAQLGPRDAKEV